MTRLNLEHIIRAAGTIADDSDVIVIGSQAILGQFPAAHEALLVSLEADVYPKNHPERSDLIDGSIGQDSPFHRHFGYYAHGVDASTAVLPGGWQERLILVSGENTSNVRGWCLEVHDLALAKLVAGRPKDMDFVRELVRQRYAQVSILTARLNDMSLPEASASLVANRIASLSVEPA